MRWIRSTGDKRLAALFLAPAAALVLSACGASEVSSSPDPTATEASTSTADTAAANSDAPSTEAAEPTTDAETSADIDADADTEGAAQAPEESSNSPIQRLSADEAIANAEVNQPNLQTSDDVLDIQTLAIADGSVQSLRDVVDGDRPVLLWFFAPH